MVTLAATASGLGSVRADAPGKPGDLSTAWQKLDYQQGDCDRGFVMRVMRVMRVMIVEASAALA